MSQQIPLSPDAEVGIDRPHHLHEVAADLAYKRLTLVNVIFVGAPGSRDWVLVDTGIPGSATAIVEAAASRFGEGVPPRCIVMTHGHFDHAGSLEALAQLWDVPIYAHRLEHPYLNGSAAYPPPDPSVGGGLMALLSPLYPKAPVNVAPLLRVLPEDGTVPEMPGWRWLAAPGHTPGQVALWRESDRALIAADAFITTCQESAYAVATQASELHGPPMYFTQDWLASAITVRKLAALQPQLAITGHGRAFGGEPLQAALRQLADRFESVAVPAHGKYVDAPTRAHDGSAYPTP